MTFAEKYQMLNDQNQEKSIFSKVVESTSLQSAVTSIMSPLRNCREYEFLVTSSGWQLVGFLYLCLHYWPQTFQSHGLCFFLEAPVPLHNSLTRIYVSASGIHCGGPRPSLHPQSFRVISSKTLFPSKAAQVPGIKSGHLL